MQPTGARVAERPTARRRAKASSWALEGKELPMEEGHMAVMNSIDETETANQRQKHEATQLSEAK